MPIYVYQSDAGEILERYFPIQGQIPPEIKSRNVTYKRVFTVPQAIVGQNDPFNERLFIEKTAKSSKLGEVWDRAAELSSKRAEKNGGIDPLKVKSDEKYSKERNGRKRVNKLGIKNAKVIIK